MIDIGTQLSKLFPAKLMPFMAICLADPKKLAIGIDKSVFSWKLIFQVYLVFMVVGFTIIDRIAKHHEISGIDSFDAAIYYTLSMPIVALMMMIPFTFSQDRADFNKHLKVTFVIYGVLFALNSILLPFQIHLLLGGNRVVVLVPAVLVCIWTIRAWTTFPILNKVNELYKKVLAFFLTAILVLLAPLVTYVLAEYFVHTT